MTVLFCEVPPGEVHEPGAAESQETTICTYIYYNTYSIDSIHKICFPYPYIYIYIEIYVLVEEKYPHTYSLGEVCNETLQ